MQADKARHRLFHDSLARVTRSDVFFKRFYERFMSESEETRKLFEGKDMVRIQEKLKMTLQMVADTVDGVPGMDMYLSLLGRIHNRMNISPAQFTLWRQALTDTAAECDTEFYDHTREVWEQAIDIVIARMQKDD